MILKEIYFKEITLDNDSKEEFKEKLEGELELIIAESGIKGIEYKEFMA